MGGGMLTFLVLLPLHVATLHRCLVVLLLVSGGHVDVSLYFFRYMLPHCADVW